MLSLRLVGAGTGADVGGGTGEFRLIGFSELFFDVGDTGGEGWDALDLDSTSSSSSLLSESSSARLTFRSLFRSNALF